MLNIQRLGDSLLLYDTPEYVEKMSAALEKIEAEAAASIEAQRTHSSHVEVSATEWSPT